MKSCPSHKPNQGGYLPNQDKAERGLEQRQCPVCLRWFFRGEFGKGWGKAITEIQNNAEMTPIQYFVFVFKKGDKIKALAFEDAKQQETGLLADGWKHIGTIDAVAFIQYHYTESENIGTKDAVS